MKNSVDRSNDPKLEPVQCLPLEVKVYNNFDAAFKAFRAVVQKDRVLSLYKERQFYEKPSQKKRRKKAECIRKLNELDLKQKRILSGEFEKDKKRKEKKKQDKNTSRPQSYNSESR